jgi:hypothetical protein
MTGQGAVGIAFEYLLQEYNAERGIKKTNKIKPHFERLDNGGIIIEYMHLSKMCGKK